MTELDGNIYTMDDCNVSAKTFSLNNSADTADIDSTGYKHYSPNGTTTAQRFENTFSGFEHLEGREVVILGDGLVQASQTVSVEGGFTIINWVNKLCAGLPFTSIIETMPIAIETQEGSTLASQKRINSVAINFYKSLGTEYGIEGSLDEVFTETSLVTGWKDLKFEHGYSKDEATIYIQQSVPLPLTIREIVPSITVSER
jgi:hypothetical protein